MTSTDPIARIDPIAASDLAADGALLLDVRKPEEWRIGHIADAVHMPLGDLRPESKARAEAGLSITTDDGAPGAVG